MTRKVPTQIASLSVIGGERVAHCPMTNERGHAGLVTVRDVPMSAVEGRKLTIEKIPDGWGWRIAR